MLPKPAKRKNQRYCPCLTNHQIKLNPNGTYTFCSPNCSLKTWLSPADNCLTDAQNCLYFNYFNSKEKKLYTRFIDKFEANFEGQQFLENPTTNRNHQTIILTILKKLHQHPPNRVRKNPNNTLKLV